MVFVISAQNIINIFSRTSRNIIKTMSGKNSIERIKENANSAQKTIVELKSELEIVNAEYNKLLSNQLQEENKRLLAAVEAAKTKLVQLEISNGIKQIDIQQKVTNTATVSCVEIRKENVEAAVVQSMPKKKTNKSNNNSQPVEEKIDVGRLDLRIGKVVNVEKHPDADSLYVLKINCGENELRTVCSGLVKHVSIDELKERLVMVLCNLKPVKMRGVTSQAMVMCASSPDGAGVEVLLPPTDAQPGDLVQCTGYDRRPDSVMNPKKKIFETVAPDLHTDSELRACYKNVPLEVNGNGNFVAKTLKNVPVK